MNAKVNVMAALASLTLLGACASSEQNASEVAGKPIGGAPTESSRQDAMAVSKVDGKLVNIRGIQGPCPSGASCQPASELTFSFTMGGCVDRLGPVQLDRSFRDGKYDYRISAVNIHTRGSMTTRCIVAQTETVTVFDRPFLSNDDLEVSGLQSIPERANLPAGFLKLTPVKAELVGVRTLINPSCPAGATCEPGTAIDLKFMLPGCVDSLVQTQYTYSYDSEANKWRYKVTGIVAQTKASLTARCIAAPMATVTIGGPMGFLSADDLTIEALEQVEAR